MTEVPTPKDGGNASHEYTAINTIEDPEIGRKKNAEKKWQTEPRRLKEFTIFIFIALCWDVLVMLMPMAFIGELVFSVFIRCFLDASSSNILFTAPLILTTLILTKTPWLWSQPIRMQCARVTNFSADEPC